jgi:hypothetical protein
MNMTCGAITHLCLLPACRIWCDQGGAVCISTAYAFVYGRTPVRLANWAHARMEALKKHVRAPSAKTN